MDDLVSLWLRNVLPISQLWRKSPQLPVNVFPSITARKGILPAGGVQVTLLVLRMPNPCTGSHNNHFTTHASIKCKSKLRVSSSVASRCCRSSPRYSEKRGRKLGVTAVGTEKGLVCYSAVIEAQTDAVVVWVQYPRPFPPPLPFFRLPFTSPSSSLRLRFPFSSPHFPSRPVSYPVPFPPLSVLESLGI